MPVPAHRCRIPAYMFYTHSGEDGGTDMKIVGPIWVIQGRTSGDPDVIQTCYRLDPMVVQVGLAR